MATDSKSTLSVAAAFAAAMLAAPASHAEADATEPIPLASDTDPVPQPSPAALERLEEAAQLAIWWMPFIPPKFVDLWPEVTHVETIRTA